MSCTKTTTRTDSQTRCMGDLSPRRTRLQGRGLLVGWIGGRVRTTPTRSTCLILDTQSWLRTSRTQRTFTNVRPINTSLKRKGPQALRNACAVFRETFTLAKAMVGLRLAEVRAAPIT